MRYFIRFAYDGTAYHGWQVQPNADTVQARLDQALATLLRRPVTTVGAGRTDTGVHARTMVAHFDWDTPLDTAALAERLNRLLPPDIAVDWVRPVSGQAHARFSALSRTYHYDIATAKNPFSRRFATRIYYRLDFALMNRAAALLLGTHDFKCFSKTGTDTRTDICTVTEARWEQLDSGAWRFRITADRFLRNMVRAVVGTLFAVGRGKLTLDGFAAVLASRDRGAAGESAPAEGLALVDVAYPDSVWAVGEEAIAE
ncbi:MAG: tRNA pseudouridine(38-40) synthase TruA [Bacteroidaceae bacterium]|nr:tRNA pseudouridine(38-40) synthase TruA [Bacteroidaceae bacterium]